MTAKERLEQVRHAVNDALKASVDGAEGVDYTCFLIAKDEGEKAQVFMIASVPVGDLPVEFPNTLRGIATQIELRMRERMSS